MNAPVLTVVTPPGLQFDGDELTRDQIPDPTGWRIVLGPIKVQEKTSGGIIMTSDTKKVEETVRFIAKVLKMGPLCYKHEKFKTHPDAKTITPWCKVGDIVSLGPYAGAKIPCSSPEGLFELKVVNDDEIHCVVSDTSILNI